MATQVAVAFLLYLAPLILALLCIAAAIGFAVLSSAVSERTARRKRPAAAPEERRPFAVCSVNFHDETAPQAAKGVYDRKRKG